jgi:hypothetical protein
MSSCQCGGAIANENVAEQPYKSITLEEKTEAIRRMEGGQLCPTACRDLNMTPPL